MWDPSSLLCSASGQTRDSKLTPALGADEGGSVRRGLPRRGKGKGEPPGWEQRWAAPSGRLGNPFVEVLDTLRVPEFLFIRTLMEGADRKVVPTHSTQHALEQQD